ncbi:MAG: cell division protein FtsZ [Oscillospiraceae bacterium]|nr:cell division protein FtsZ [Oscillospiraceae bacterium]
MAFEIDNHDDEFVMDDDFEDQTKIMVIGVGGGGGNAVSHMVEGGMTGIDYVVANTDVKALRSKDGSRMRRIQIGKKRTKGQGAGNKPQVGQESAEENRDELKAVMEDESMVFIAAGMGGGTGTGAAPVVANIAKELGKLTVGVVTKPFAFEGQAKMNQALKGIAEMRKYVDSLIVIPNEKVKEISNAKLSMIDAFKAVDSVLYKAVKGISDLVKGVGFMSVDFADVTMALKDSGIAHMAIGTGKGDNKNEEALDQVLHSPLLETSILGARRLLINISIPMTTSADEVDGIASEITKNAAPDAEIKMGMQFDEELAEDEVSVIVIATDFVTDEDGNPVEAPAGAAQDSFGAGFNVQAPEFGGDNDIDKLINILNSK